MALNNTSFCTLLRTWCFFTLYSYNMVFNKNVVPIWCFLDTNVNMADDFTIDSMHAIYQNWMKRFWKHMHTPRNNLSVSNAFFLKIR